LSGVLDKQSDGDTVGGASVHARSTDADGMKSEQAESMELLLGLDLDAGAKVASAAAHRRR